MTVVILAAVVESLAITAPKSLRTRGKLYARDASK